MSQRMRRNASPSTSNVTKQGPLKAVRAFCLKNGSEKHYSTRKSPDYGLSPERRTPASPCVKEKGRPHFQSPVQYLAVSGCRASSADPSLPYLTGQWPKDITSYHHYHSGSVFMCDKSTQTVGIEQISENKFQSKGHRRSSSLDHGELSKELIKQRLQKSKEGSRQEWSKQRWSPVAGVHCALSLTAPPTVFARSKPIISPTRHIPAKNMTRFQRNSVEGLNMEIEKLVLSKSAATSGHDVDDLHMEFPKNYDIPDGRRAPAPQVNRLSCTRSIDTQTPSRKPLEEQLTPFVAGHGWDALSVDTAQPFVAWGAEMNRPLTPGCSNSEHSQLDSRLTSLDSKPNKCHIDQGSPDLSLSVPSPMSEKSCPFVREPPDGCEKVKVMEESRRPLMKEPLFCPVKPMMAFKPSQDSAFCPLMKHYLGEATTDRAPLLQLSAQMSPGLA